MKWKKLRLNKTDGRPELGSLAAIRMMPKSIPDRRFAGDGRYEVGRLDVDPRNPKSKKLWWYSGFGNVADLSERGKKYDIWWCYVFPFDGIN